jgi:hypothetical protein
MQQESLNAKTKKNLKAQIEVQQQALALQQQAQRESNARLEALVSAQQEQTNLLREQMTLAQQESNARFEALLARLAPVPSSSNEGGSAPASPSSTEGGSPPTNEGGSTPPTSPPTSEALSSPLVGRVTNVHPTLSVVKHLPYWNKIGKFIGEVCQFYIASKSQSYK